MKKILSSFIILTFSLTLFAQNADLEHLYYSYKGEEGVVAIRIPGFLLRFASSVADLEKEERQLLRSMKSVKVLTIEDPALYHNVNFVDEINLNRLNNGYKLLMQVREGDEDVAILAREKNGCIKDLVVLVGGDDNVMVHIKGRMNSDLIGSLADVAGIDELKYTKGI